MKFAYTLALIVLTSIIMHAQNEKRLALVIGNSNYTTGGVLKNPVNDANLMATTLAQLGFEVIKKTNADLRTMQMAEIDFKSNLNKYDVALFYYAGHGIQVDGINYLIPIDAKLDNKEYTKYEAFDISNINSAFRENVDNVNIMILDACRDNPFRSWERGGNRGFKKIENSATGTIIAFATQPGETAADGAGTNGLYTSELVKQMVKSQAIEQVFKKTRIEVNNISNGKQIPQDWSSLMADFYFTNNDIKVDVKAENTRSTKIISNTDITSNKSTHKSMDLPNVLYDQRDGKRYKIVEIGNQIWMAENLNYVTSSGSWYYNENNNNGNKYGRLYTYKTAQNVCPTGWHLPSKAEFKILLDKYQSAENAYSAIKNGGRTGFNAIFGGTRSDNGIFFGIGESSAFWSSTEAHNPGAWRMYISNIKEKAYLVDEYQSYGISVRCIKD